MLGVESLTFFFFIQPAGRLVGVTGKGICYLEPWEGREGGGAFDLTDAAQALGGSSAGAG